MKTDIDAIHLRHARLKLTIWGSWCNQVMSWGLNYSDRSLLYRLIKEGGVLIQSTATSLGPDNQEAEEVNSWVEALGKEQPHLAKVLCMHYIEAGAAKEKINRMRISKASYFNYLREAERIIASKIR